MPRKTRPRAPRSARPGRFNEAAARCRGKHLPQHLDPLERLAASMRPRPDAAENLLKGNEEASALVTLQ